MGDFNFRHTAREVAAFTFILDLQVIRDIKNKTYTYKTDLYLDASENVWLVTQPNTGSLWNSTLTVGDKRLDSETTGHFYSFSRYEFPQNFTIASDISKPIHLATHVTDPIPVGDETEPIPIRYGSNVHYGNTLRVWDTIIHYYEVSGECSVGAIANVDPIRPYTAAGLDGTRILGTPHTLNLNKGEDEYTHTVEYLCGDEVIELCSKSKDLAIPFTPVERLAALNTSETTVTVPFRIHSYYDDTLAYTKTVEYTFNIPEDARPSCKLLVQDGETKDGEPVADIYGGFVQNHSSYNVQVIPTLAYYSDIVEYNITIDGVNYKLANNEITTDIIKTPGRKTISASVTDGRGRTSDTVEVTVDVIPYEAPYISSLRAKRCNADGTENPIGDFMKVVFSTSVSPINDKNSATYVLHQSKATGTDAKDEVLSTYTGEYVIENGVHIFEANRGYAYIVELRVLDDFETKTRQTGGGLAAILMNWLASGKGLCFGGLASVEDTFECQFKFYPSGGYMLPAYPSKDLFSKTPNIYYVQNPSDIYDCPTDAPFIFEIMQLSADGLDVMQRITTCPQGAAPRILVRVLRQSSWGSWYDMTTGQTVVI